MKLIIDNHYFADFISFKNLIKSSYICLEQYEEYRKTGFRNRCRLAGGNGLLLLSVPLVGGRDQRRPMREVRIDYGKDWQRDHWRSIVSAYRRSPFFEFYELELQKIYGEKYEYLQDWNRACLAWALAKLGWRGELVFTDAFQKLYDKSQYLDFRSCATQESRVGEVTPVYRQVFEERHGFLSNLSILDLLFCEGPGAAGLLVG